MTNNKQSSVEWLVEQLEKHYVKTDLKNTVVYQQAKAMHKQEIMDANFYGQRLHAKSVTNTMMEDNAEHYYNETFGGKL